MNPAKLIRFAVDAVHAVFIRDRGEPSDLDWEFVDQLVLHYPGDQEEGSLFHTYEAFINGVAWATAEEERYGMHIALLQFVRGKPPSWLSKMHKLAKVAAAEHAHQHDPAVGKKPTGVNPRGGRTRRNPAGTAALYATRGKLR